MALDDPATLDLSGWFRDPAMFDSRRAWRRAGFAVLVRSSAGKIMVAGHADLPRFLFKKYASAVPDADQRFNYARRVEGAVQLREFTARRGYARLAIPRKWILKLPPAFGRRGRILVVERLDLRDERATNAAYRDIDPRTLAELCVVLAHYRGMDSIVKNMPFAVDGRIAFVDTEHWDRSSSKLPLHRVAHLLTQERRHLARKIFERVRNDRSVDVAQLVGTVHGAEGRP